MSAPVRSSTANTSVTQKQTCTMLDRPAAIDWPMMVPIGAPDSVCPSATPPTTQTGTIISSSFTSRHQVT